MSRKNTKLVVSISKAIILLSVLLVCVTVHIPSTSSYFVSNVTSVNNQVLLKADWTPPPVPVLRYPSNNTVMKSAGLTQNWTFVTDSEGSNPVIYFYESCKVNPADSGGLCPSNKIRHTETLTISKKKIINSEEQIVKTSGNNANDGIFWWRVRAIDSAGNKSAWSETWKLTLDSTKPQKPQMKTVYKGHDTTAWKEIGCGGFTNDTRITIQWNPSSDPNISYYWFGNKNNPRHAKVTHPQFHYSGNMTPGNNPYSYTIIAVDKAGNESEISDSCGVNFDNAAPDVLLSINGEYEKNVVEKIENGDFKQGLNEWATAGDVSVMNNDMISVDGGDPIEVEPTIGPKMARIGSPSYPADEGNKVWENRLMQSIKGGAKSISVHYNFFSQDYWDDPGFFIRLNDSEVFALNSQQANNGWSKFYYDLSGYNDEDFINLALYAGNTDGGELQSWAYVDAITTQFVSANSDATYSLSGTDGLSGINHNEYNINGSGWKTYISSFQLDEPGEYWLEYKSVDNAGNDSVIKKTHVIVDDSPPDQIADLEVTDTGTNYAVLEWTAPGGGDGSDRASKYDIRYSTADILDDEDFQNATQAGNITAPQTEGNEEELEILGLTPGTKYYFAIKAADEAPNWSLMTKDEGTTKTLTPPDTVSPGDIIINELMWMGSSAGEDDEWIELRNMTDRDINLNGFKFVGHDGTIDNPMFSISEDKIIKAKRYFLISNQPALTSRLNNDLDVDYVTADVELNNEHLSIKLYDPQGDMVDEAWNGSAPKEGLFTLTAYFSMERTSVPGKGDDELNWYTCIDEASSGEFFDSVGLERGTPGAANRSENEPYTRSTLEPRDDASVSSTPSASLIISDTRETASIKAENISKFNSLIYTLKNNVTGKVIADNTFTPEEIDGRVMFEADGIILETCSDGVCTKLTDTENLILEIILTRDDGSQLRMEAK